MIHVLTPATVRRPRALAEAAPGRPLLRRGLALAPPGGPLTGVYWRLVIEFALVRYLIALAPFPVAMLIWPDLALPISQAPLLMIGIVLFIETSVLSVSSPSKRRAMVEAAEAARGLDTMRARARAALTRIAADRGLDAGTLHLVIEQSAMLRVTPLTLVSIQRATAEPPVLDLDAAERERLAAALFDAAFDERALQRINTAENSFVRSYALEAHAVPAHARLEAHARRRAALATAGAT